MPRESDPVPVHLKAGLSVAEVTELVPLSDTAVRRLVESGVLARAPHTDRVVIARRELDRWLESTMPRVDVAS
jgi:hypothetical protein